MIIVAIGVTMEGSKEVLGLWTSATEGAKLPDPPCTVLDLGQHFLCFENVADSSPKIKVAMNWTTWLKKD